MKIKKNFYKLGLFGFVSLPLVVGSVSCSKPSTPGPTPTPDPSIEPKLSKISIDMEENEFDVETATQFISEPLSVQCFDQDGNHFDAKTEWHLSQKDGDDVPNWININGNNEIVITLPRIMESQYSFEIQAESIDEKVKSNVEEFVVNITGESPKAPDSILIECKKSDWDIFYSDTGNIQMKVKPFSQQFPVEVLDKNCDWSITKITGNNPFDLDQSPLFYLDGENDKKSLKISPNVDSTYCEKSFIIEIKAISLSNESAIANTTIKVTFKNGFYYSDPDTQFIYSRQSLDDTWSLSLAPSNTNYFKDVKDQIFDIPVTKVSENICSRSGIKKCVSLALPDSITEIGDYAFANQSYLYAVVGSGIKTIGNNAFYGDEHIYFAKDHDIPQFVYVGKNAFYKCYSLILDDQNSMISIGDYAFSTTKMTSLKFGPNLIKIGNGCFNNCASLKTLTFESSTPPHLDGVLYDGTTSISMIRVPNLSLDLYKNDTSWSLYQKYLIGY